MSDPNDIFVDNLSKTQYLDGLSSDIPVSLSFRFNASETEVIQLLNSSGMKAVLSSVTEIPKEDLLRVAVVCGSNVEMPFVNQASAKRMGEFLEHIFADAHMDISAYIYPQTIEQKLLPRGKSGLSDKNNKILQKYNKRKF